MKTGTEQTRPLTTKRHGPGSYTITCEGRDWVVLQYGPGFPRCSGKWLAYLDLNHSVVMDPIDTLREVKEEIAQADLAWLDKREDEAHDEFWN